MEQIGDDASVLTLWGRGGRVPLELYGLVIPHSRLPLAARALARNMEDLAASDRAIDAVFKDAGRYVAAMWAFHLHADGGRLTLPRLKDICVQSGLLSPGRARAMIQFLLHLGYLVPVTSGRAGVAAVYEPTPAFNQAWEAQIRCALEAALIIDPGVAPVLDALHEPLVLQTFARIHAENLLASVAGGMEPPPFARVFLHPYAGPQIVWTLILAAEDDHFPPERSGPVSFAALARKFGVSRIHIKRVFDEAEREGLVTVGADGMVTLSPDASEYLRFHFGAQIAQLIGAAPQTIADVPGPAAGQESAVLGNYAAA